MDKLENEKNKNKNSEIQAPALSPLTPPRRRALLPLRRAAAAGLELPTDAVVDRGKGSPARSSSDLAI